MTETPILELRNLTKRFPGRRRMMGLVPGQDVQAVSGIDFSVGRGETLALVGESGCGKTTTIKMILRLVRPTSGQVLFEGRDVWAMDRSGVCDLRRRVQAVFQDPFASLNPYMRVHQIVGEPLVIQGGMTAGERARRIDEVLEAVGLSSRQAMSYPHEFSGGQRQRVAIAAALVSKPALMVLDEPVSALDVSIRAQIMNLFKEIQERYGVSYIVVAHDLGTTRFLSDSIAVMYLGRVVEHGSSDAVFTDPRHPYTRALMSAALPATPDKTDEEIILSGEPPSPIAPPSGCAFHPRCQSVLGRICEDVPPETVDVDAAGHRVACHIQSQRNIRHDEDVQ